MRVIKLLTLFASLWATSSAWKIVDSNRLIDGVSQVVKVTTTLDLENDGDASSVVEFAIGEQEEKHLSFIQGTQDKQKGKLKITKGTVKDGFQTYKVELRRKVEKGGKVKIVVDTRMVESLTPYPAKITQKDQQYVLYEGSAHTPSVYPIANDKTIVKLPSGIKILSATTVQPSKQDQDKVTYGPYKDVAAFSKMPIKVHYENNSPFVVATVVERTIEVSHWGGNIAVEEYIELVHKGAELKGTFSRLDHSQDRRGRRNPALQHFTTVLPASARDIYYRDEIGNITTSAVRVRADSVDVEIRPRFPLYGGWKTSYVIGYNVPSYEYLFTKDGNYALKMRVLDHIYDNVVIEKLTTKIVLPEHVKKVKLATPYPMERGNDETRPTYLDTTGRTVVVLRKEKLVNDHIQTLTVSYEFDATMMLREPLMVTAFLLCLFVAVIAYVRFDFSIVADPAKDARERITGKLAKLDGLVDEKQKLFARLIDDLNDFKNSRNDKILADAKKNLETSRNEVNDVLTKTINEIKEDSNEAYEKALELLRYDKTAMETVAGVVEAVSRSQQKNGGEEQPLLNKVADARHKADLILASI